MKKITLILSFLLFANSNVFAQKRKFKEKIRAYKIAYLTEQLDLTENEAVKFWPVYNAYDKRVQEIRHQERYNFFKKIKEAGGIDEISETEAEKIAKEAIALELEDEKITREFYLKLPSILTYKKILKLEMAEKSFHRKLLRKYRDRPRH